MDMLKIMRLGSLVLLLGSLCNGAAAAPQAGWWWNPNESGRGFFIESRNGLIFMAGYLYDNDGHALWVAAGGPNADAYNYTGRLLAYNGGQTLLGGYRAPSGTTDVGPVSIHFSDDIHATLTWPGGTLQLERQLFGAGIGNFQPINGWWWNPNESGRGYSLEVQGNALFWVGFMYEASGRPVWYLSGGAMNSDTTYTGDLLQFANGQTITGPYQPPGSVVKVGTIDIAFTAQNHASLTFSGLTPQAALAKTSKAGPSAQIDIVPELNATLGYVPPTLYTGSFTMADRYDSTDTSQTDKTIQNHVEFQVGGRNVRWTIPPGGAGFNALVGGYTATYGLAQATLDLSLNAITTTTTSAGVDRCVTSGTWTRNVTAPILPDSTLQVTSFGQFALNLQGASDSALIIPEEALSFDCVLHDGTPFHQSVTPVQLGLAITGVGSVSDDEIRFSTVSGVPLTGPFTAARRTWAYQFSAAR